MLNNVSWGQYFSGVILILVLYYLIITLIFYRDEIQSFLQPKISGTDAGQQKNHNADQTTNALSVPEAEQAADGLQVVVSDLRGILEAGKEASKEQLLEQLSQRLANYAGLRLPAFRAALSKFIIQHAESICGVILSEEELEEAWAGLPR